MRDHGGNIDWAISRYGGNADEWIDLSTGINRVPYPVPALKAEAWTALPTRAAMDGLVSAAGKAYGTEAAIVPLAGAQAAIQMIPRLARPGRARILAPTYNEHGAALRAEGWQVAEVGDPGALEGADLAVVVNPNNPDGRRPARDQLLRLAERVGMLVVDESFADADPAQSLAAQCGRPGLVVLRSFGKFYGLAGLRLGFALGHEDSMAALSGMAGPWPVSGAAIEIGRAALADRDWARTTTGRLAVDTARLDALAASAGWKLVGGCALFRLYDTGDAALAQEGLARARIWSRMFPYSSRWLRLGLPGSEPEWSRLDAALANMGAVHGVR